MAECILTSTETRSRRIELNKYCLDKKARAMILSRSDSAKSKRFGKTNITTQEIETQRQAFIRTFGNEFGLPSETILTFTERNT